MLTEYETGFTIQETSGLVGNALLTKVADKLEFLLTYGGDDGPPRFTERETSASSGYSVITADRLHHLVPKHTVRIQARLCTKGKEVTAQIRSRFISSDGNDPPNLTAGPPRILKEIVDNYECKIGIDQYQYHFRREVFRVEDVPTAREVMNFITNSNRKIPVLVLTDSTDGDTVIEPELAFDYLLGLALVVHFKGETSRCIGDTPGIQACFNGAMRFFWPGSPESKFYWPQDAANISITQFQKDCIENADSHDLNGDFEQIFSSVRTKVIREQRSKQELTALSWTTQQLAQAQERIYELERIAKETEMKNSQTVDELLEQLNVARTVSGAVSDSEKDKEIRKLNTAANQWKRRLRQSEDSNRELRKENSDLKASLERAEVEAAATKVPAITEEVQEGLSLTGNARIDNVTILNHAINIYRNPARQYIIKALRKRYNNNLKEICEAIERTMNSDDDRRRLREAESNSRPQDAIDVGNFEYIVMNNTACFGEKRRLSTRMSDVRQVRNAAAHPEYNGIDNLKAKDGLNKVAGALREMGNNDYGKLVEQLLPLVR